MDAQNLFLGLDSPTLDIVEAAKAELLRAVSKTKDPWLVRNNIKF